MIWVMCHAGDWLALAVTQHVSWVLIVSADLEITAKVTDLICKLSSSSDATALHVLLLMLSEAIKTSL